MYGISQEQRSNIMTFANYLRGIFQRHLAEIQQAKAQRKLKEIDKEVALRKAESCFVTARAKPSIYQGQEAIDKETLASVAQTFSNNVEHQRRLKQRIIEEDPRQLKSLGDSAEVVDPRISYTKRCLEAVDLNLPILDKIYRKTLCLQDYHLSEGNCQGLADACEHLDTAVINRMLFNNCGLTGETLSLIIDGVSMMKDFKALMYCRQTLNADAILKLSPIIARPIPYHLEEISLVDTRMGATLIEQLADTLIENRNRLKKFTLINVQHSDRSFERITDFIRESEHLQEVDLSWSMVRPQQMLKLLKVIEGNRKLTNLTLSHNLLLEKQVTELTEQQRQDGLTEVELSPFNAAVVVCFKDFIKYNAKLNHLNLERCGLNEPALKYIAALLRKSQALRCLHLCGNPGLSREVIEWMRARIHARPARGVRLMEPLKATVKYNHNVGETKGTAKKGMPLRRGLMKVHRQGSIEFQTPK